MFDQSKYSSFRQLIRNRIRSLLIPYFIYSVATWCVWILHHLVDGTKRDFLGSLLQTVIAQGSGGYLVHNVALWFVTCLFVVDMMYYFICKLPDIANIVLCMVMAAVGHFMVCDHRLFDFTKLPWNLEVAMSAMLFYCAGNLLAKSFGKNIFAVWCNNAPKLCSILLLALLTAFFSGSIWNGHITLGSNLLGRSTVLLYLNGLTGTFAVLLAVNLIPLLKLRWCEMLLAGIRYIGRNSFHFMAVHFPLKNIMAFLLVHCLRRSGVTYESLSNEPLQSLLLFSLTLTVSIVVVMMIRYVLRRLECRPRAAGR